MFGQLKGTLQMRKVLLPRVIVRWIEGGHSQPDPRWSLNSQNALPQGLFLKTVHNAQLLNILNRNRLFNRA
jgi:hypothetical protein